MGSKAKIEVLRQKVDDHISSHAREHDMIAMAMVLAHESSDRNLSIALDSMNSRLAGMNEFRAQLSDAASTYVTRNEWSSGYKSLDDKYDSRFRGLERLVYMAAGVVIYFLKKG